MNGSATNGTHPPQQDADPQDLFRLTEALNAIHDGRSTNAARKDATIYLESAKSLPDAASVGFQLASSHDQPALARHYGLSLLEYTIRYKWESLEPQQSQALREWVVALADGVIDDDPLFLRNKVAHIWLELVKRCWLDEWPDMDQQLFRLWGKSFAHQAVVLQLLELLSEDAFDNDDVSLYLKNATELRRACIEIFTSSAFLASEYPDRTMGNSSMRHGDEGWFLRLLQRLRWCIDNYDPQQPQIRACVLQVLQTLRSMMPWMYLKALHGTACIDSVCRVLQLSDDPQLQLAAVDVLHSICHRTQFQDQDVVEIVYPLLSDDGMRLMRYLYQHSTVSVDDIDDSRYLLCKKLTELFCAVGSFIEHRPQQLSENVNVGQALDFFLELFRAQSLVVSIPIVYLWSRLLACKHDTIARAVDPLIASLLELSSQRLLRYEALPADSEDETFRFLNEDFDTMPERHAFVGNYRRFCSEIIERVVRRSPFDAMRHILSQADTLFTSLPSSEVSINKDEYNSNSFNILRVDAQCTVITSAVKGYLNWLTSQKSKGIRHDSSHDQLQTDIEQWSANLLNRDFQDPIVQKRILHLISELTSNVLKHESPVPLSICEHVLSRTTIQQADSTTTYGEAIKELQSSLPRMLQKLAMRYSDVFMNVYAELEQGIERTTQSDLLEQRTKIEYRGVLLIIVHRTTLLSVEEKRSRLNNMVEPILQAWRDPTLLKAASSFEDFCDFLGLDQFPQYFLSAKAQNAEDWSKIELDSKGFAMRDRISTRSETLPLQALKCFLTVSTDRIHQNSPNFSVAESLWEVAIPIVLPTLLQLLSHAHAFGNPDKWSRFPNEMQVIVRRTLVDRVWQAGISSESRDDFFNRVRDSKSTLEGLASATRAAVRGVRELSYWILHCLCQFSHSFFKHQDLAEPLARALYEDAHTLSSHQVSTLLRISMALIDACPTLHFNNFLPPLLSSLFTQVDRKLTAEWEAHDKRSEAAVSDDALDQEMKTESVLRQLTYSAVTLGASLLNPQGPQLPTSKRGVVFAHSGVLSALVVFANHALRMRDTRSLVHNIRALRAIIPDFEATPSSSRPTTAQSNGAAASSPPPAGVDPQTAQQLREFFAHDVLQSAITSLHEPYFADQQKDLAALIAAILAHYAAATETPRRVLLSLPGMAAPAVDAALDAVRAARSDRQMRAEVLRLLEGLRGVSIHEMGRVRDDRRRAAATAARGRSRYQDPLATAMDEDDGPRIRRGGSADLEGMGELFG